MSQSKFNRSQPAPRIVYTSPCGSLTVTRHAADDYSFAIDGTVAGFAHSAMAAESTGHALLCEMLEDAAVAEADIAAEVAEAYAADWDEDAGFQLAALDAFSADWDAANAITLVSDALQGRFAYEGAERHDDAFVSRYVAQNNPSARDERIVRGLAGVAR